VGFAEYEVILGIAQEISGSIHTLKNLPGAISDLLEKTAKKFNADYILIDMSPSLGSINQNLLMTSDFFLVPTTADFLSVMAIDSLSRILPKWCAWTRMASANPILKEATYPFPEFRLKFLGTIVQNYRIMNGKETKAFQTWIEKVENTVTNKLKPILEKNNLLLPNQVYTEQGINCSFTITKIPSSNSLIALSQKHATPVYALTPEQLNQQGIVAEINKKQQEEFKTIFSDLADKIIALSSSYAVSP
ncbi:MAG: AAA family ATPase, partial [Dolichospermum sp.]